MELSGKQIFSNVLGIPGPSCEAVAAVLDDGLDALGTAYPKDSFIIHMDAVFMSQIIVYAAISLVRAFFMVFLDFIGYILIFTNPVALLSGFPLVIGRLCYVKQPA